MKRTVGYIGVHPSFDLLEQHLLSAPQAGGMLYPALRPGYGRQPLQAVGDVCLVPQLRRELESLLEQIPRTFVITLGLRQDRQGIKR